MAQPRKLPNWLIPVLGYALSIACMVYVYQGFDWHAELARIREVDWIWIWLAVAAEIVVYAVQGVRWNLLGRPVAQIPVIRSIQAVYIGLFANEILALKPGEVIRSFLLARWANIPFPVALSTAIVERVFDGIWLFAGFYAISRYVALPGAVVIAAKVLMAILLLVCIALAAAVLHKRKPGGYLQSRRWARNLIPLADGLYAMGHSHTFLTSFALSFVYLALQVLPIYFVIRGYQLDLNIGVAAVILVMLRVSSAAPQAPGNLGTFQAAAVAGVKLFGYDKAEATGFATLLFIVVTMPLWIAGFFALLATRMKLDDLHRDAHYNADRHA